MRAKGFTLIELIVVMVIIGILAVFVSGRLDFASAFDRKGAQDKIIAVLQFARKAAVAQRRNVCLCVGTKSGATCTAGNRLELSLDTRTPESGAAFCNGTSEIPLALPAADSKCGGATNAACVPANVATLSSSQASFSFDALGRPSSSVVLGLSNSDGLVNVTVEAETGYVH